MTLFELIVGAFAALLSAVVSVLWNKVDTTEKAAASNRILVEHLTKQIEKTNDLAQRLSSLETAVNVEIKNLSISIKRMESAILRIDQNSRQRPN